jgi:hypothetical protein
MYCEDNCECSYLGEGGAAPETAYIPEDAFCQTDTGLEEPCLEVSVTADREPSVAEAEGGAGGADMVAPASNQGEGGTAAFAEVDPVFLQGIPSGVEGPPWFLIALLFAGVGLLSLAYSSLTREDQE